MGVPQTPRTTWQLKAFPIFTILGWILITAALIIGILVLSTTASSYWGDSSKAVRDAAPAGSELLGSLETLNTIPRWLEPLAFLGVASFMLGIALEFSSIPAILKNRGQILGICFPLLARE